MKTLVIVGVLLVSLAAQFMAAVTADWLHRGHGRLERAGQWLIMVCCSTACAFVAGAYWNE